MLAAGVGTVVEAIVEAATDEAVEEGAADEAVKEGAADEAVEEEGAVEAAVNEDAVDKALNEGGEEETEEGAVLRKNSSLKFLLLGCCTGVWTSVMFRTWI